MEVNIEREGKGEKITVRRVKKGHKESYYFLFTQNYTCKCMNIHIYLK